MDLFGSEYLIDLDRCQDEENQAHPDLDVHSCAVRIDRDKNDPDESQQSDPDGIPEGFFSSQDTDGNDQQ